MKITRLLLPLAAVVLVGACAPEKALPPLPENAGGGAGGGGGEGGAGGGEMIAPEFPEGTGQVGADGGYIYAGPYGVGIASVIPNYQFLGYPRANVAKTLKKVQLTDFYNPTGTEVWEAGSPYGEGVPKPKALLLIRSAVWCSPCNYEAANEFPGRHLQFAPAGEFIECLDDGPVPGTPATVADLDRWVTKYKVNYPAILNPAATLSAIVGIEAYPGHVIVRTKDMKIIKWEAGVSNAAFWALFADVIAGKPVLPGE
jgi:hypothetical protein